MTRLTHQLPLVAAALAAVLTTSVTQARDLTVHDAQFAVEHAARGMMPYADRLRFKILTWEAPPSFSDYRYACGEVQYRDDGQGLDRDFRTFRATLWLTEDGGLQASPFFPFYMEVEELLQLEGCNLE